MQSIGHACQPPRRSLGEWECGFRGLRVPLTAKSMWLIGGSAKKAPKEPSTESPSKFGTPSTKSRTYGTPTKSRMYATPKSHKLSKSHSEVHFHPAGVPCKDSTLWKPLLKKTNDTETKKDDERMRVLEQMIGSSAKKDGKENRRSEGQITAGKEARKSGPPRSEGRVSERQEDSHAQRTLKFEDENRNPQNHGRSQEGEARTQEKKRIQEELDRLEIKLLGCVSNSTSQAKNTSTRKPEPQSDIRSFTPIKTAVRLTLTSGEKVTGQVMGVRRIGSTPHIHSGMGDGGASSQKGVSPEKMSPRRMRAIEMQTKNDLRKAYIQYTTEMKDAEQELVKHYCEVDSTMNPIPASTSNCQTPRKPRKPLHIKDEHPRCHSPTLRAHTPSGKTPRMAGTTPSQARMGGTMPSQADYCLPLPDNRQADNGRYIDELRQKSGLSPTPYMAGSPMNAPGKGVLSSPVTPLSRSAVLRHRALNEDGDDRDEYRWDHRPIYSREPIDRVRIYPRAHHNWRSSAG